MCLYELRAGTGAKSFGSSDGPNVENWKHTSTLRGHLENVLDVAWSMDDRFIASSSVDNQARRKSYDILQCMTRIPHWTPGSCACSLV